MLYTTDNIAKKPKAYNAPFWVMLFFAVAYATWVCYLLVPAWDIVASSFRSNPATFLLPVTLESLLLSQAIYYWLVRREITRKKWIWLHITATIATFGILMFLPPLSGYFFEYYYSGGNARYYMYLFGAIREYGFYLLLAAGNIFFISTIVNIYRNKKVISTGNEPTPGILDGILDEYEGL